MVERVFHGKLMGAGGEAKCVVTQVRDRDFRISNVQPPLPDGMYALLVRGLVLKVHCTNGEWKNADAS